MFRSVLRWSTAVLFAVLAVTFGGVTACGSGDSQTDCTLNGCTVTFPRSGDAEVSLLGVKARLAGVEGGNARLEIAGQTVTVPVGGEATVNDFTVGVQQITDTEVVVVITR